MKGSKAWIETGMEDYKRPEGTSIFPWHKRIAVLNHIARVFVEEGFKEGNAVAFCYGLQVTADYSVLGNEQQTIDGLKAFIAAWREKVCEEMSKIDKSEWKQTEGF